MPDRLCILTVHAHPDDESSKGPATIARYHAEGIRTVLVCCTGGEEGDVLNPAMDRPDVRSRLAEIRRSELDAATRVIGYDEVVLLGYRDSGMPGTPANENPACFAQAPLEEAVGRLVAVIRRERPQVLVTYPDRQEAYPHPDHLRVHEITVAAFDAAGDPALFPEAGPAFAPSKLYYTVWSTARFRQMHEKFLELGLPSPFEGRWTERLARPETADAFIDISGFAQVREEALLAHATQVDPTSPVWFGLPPEIRRAIYPVDEYRLAASRAPAPAGPEDDLFAGLRAGTPGATGPQRTPGPAGPTGPGEEPAIR